MKVMILFSSSALGGAERSLTRMAVVPIGVDYKLATLGPPGAWNEWVHTLGLKPLIFGRKKHKNIVQALYRLYKYLGREPVDIVYVCGTRAAFVIRLFRWLIPQTKVVHGVRWNPQSNSRLDRFFRLIERYLQKLLDGWITNSLVSKNTLVNRCSVPAKRIDVIHNGIDIPDYVLQPLSERPMEVLTVANLSPRKGHREYLQTIHRVIAKFPAARFVFVGVDDMNGEVDQAIKSSGLSEYVSFEGFQADVSVWYRRARIFVLPSLQEGCPTSILEAMANGLPTVAFDTDGVNELINDKVDGCLIKLGAYGSLADAILRLLTDLQLSTQLGFAARKKIASQFKITDMAEKHKAAFTKIMAASR